MPRGRAYRFITTPTGQHLTDREVQRTVRSHVASFSHPGSITRRQTRIRERNEGEGIIVFEANQAEPDREDDPQLLPAATRTDELTRSTRPNQSDRDQQLFNPIFPTPYRLAIDYLSGDTFSPLQHLPTYHQPYLPGIMNHYIYNLTIPIPELDGNSAVPLFRAAWLPVVFHDPVVFQIVVLFAATHYATYAEPGQFDHLYLELLSLKQSALLALIQTVQNQQNTSSIPNTRDHDSQDTLIAAAAKMASYEAIFGTEEAFHLHMSTVTRLLRQRGGLATLGMNGFLARLLSFIDTNSAFLLGTNLYLVEFGLSNQMPLHQPFPPNRSNEAAPQTELQIRNTNVVNLERFIGIMNNSSQRNEDSLRS